MGLERFCAELLCVLKAKEAHLDSILMLGRQNLNLRVSEARKIERVSGIRISDLLDEGQGNCYSEPFLERLGFSEIESMDFSDYEGASILHDLNRPVPGELEARFGVVYDGGTLEHLFDYPRAVSNAMRMVKEGGFFVACSPSNGFNGHGFYQFSPELFFRIFSESNGFRIRLLIQGEASGRRRAFSVRDPADCGFRVGLNRGARTFTVFAAQRIDATREVLGSNPIQESYESAWSQARDPGEPMGGKSGFAKLKQAIRRLVPQPWIERREMMQFERRDRKRSRSSLTRVDLLENAWMD